jgi:hypothetical protein
VLQKINQCPPFMVLCHLESENCYRGVIAAENFLTYFASLMTCLDTDSVV